MTTESPYRQIPYYKNTTLNISAFQKPERKTETYCVESGDFPNLLEIDFQDEEVSVSGVTGVTGQVLLAIVIDRLSKQDTDQDNIADVIFHLKEAIRKLTDEK